ncbi:MAG TPA: TonB-dependent receptor [Holophagaceae bacterium]|nr:TonB-dependent receptor [Holophagaceae bacterium]
MPIPRGSIPFLLAASLGAQETPGPLPAFKALLATRVESSSRQPESVREAPVPVTVITAEMIQRSGARTLKDLLVTFVPGVTAVEDQNEPNVAMHGAYASSQQKILVMLNGHRLNSRAYAMANPDWSISLDRLARVEVLRGPGSSLYGNVALTAVVNLVTKRPWEVEGTQVTFGSGNHGQRLLSVVAGHDQPGDQDILFWGQWYGNDGESRPIPAAEDYSRLPTEGSALLYGFKDRPSYDLGFTYRFGSVTLLANQRYSHYVEPFSGGGVTGEVYDYGQYQHLQGEGPGLGSLSQHLGTTYQRELGAWAMNLHLGLDANELHAVIVTDPATRSFAMPSWAERSQTARLELIRPYEDAVGDGSLLVGAEVDYLDLRSSSFPRGTNGQWTSFGDSTAKPLLAPGSEQTLSGFAQVKHHLSATHIFNVGLRIDRKHRHEGDPVSDVSPRLAWIWLPTADAEVKVSYARSFVDAPYWYRYNSLPSYRGAIELKPEHLEAFQITPSWTTPDGQKRLAFNLFHNTFRDVIYRNNQALPTEPIYTNAGRMRTWGAELEAGHLSPRFQARATLSWQRLIDAQSIGAGDGRIDHVPPFSGHLVFDVKALDGGSQALWTDLQLHHTSTQRAPIDIAFPANTGPVPSPAVSYRDLGHEEPAVTTVDAGLRWEGFLGRGSNLELRAWNCFDRTYRQGGSTTFPYPQPGRWLLLRVGLNLDRWLR